MTLLQIKRHRKKIHTFTKKYTKVYEGTINIKGQLMDLSSPKVMGIINTTPDSFYSESRLSVEEDFLKKVNQMIIDGMDILDLGGYSSRPGAKDISVEEEESRVLPFIELCSKNFPQLPLSIDTFRAQVAEKAVKAGACIINDISAGSLDRRMFDVVADVQVPYIAMHMQGNPQNMQDKPHYEDLLKEMIYYFSEKIEALRKLRVNDIIIDPGFGFAKTLEHNYELLSKMELLQNIDLPVLVGVSRKSMINKLLEIEAIDALNGTTVINSIALEKGANILRVHDVKEAKQAILIHEEIKKHK